MTDAARWIVLTPSADDAAWRERLGAAAAGAGLTLADADVPAADAGATPDLWLTASPRAAIAAGAAQGVVITPDVAALLEQPESPLSLTGLTSLTDRLSDLSALPPGFRMARPAAPGARLDLWPDLMVTPPPVTEPASPFARAARQALGLYADGAPRPGARAAWPPALFHYDARAVRGATEAGVMDVTGRPRILVWGPYFVLPPGLWRIRVRFSLDENARIYGYRMDWGGQKAFDSFLFRPDRAGVFEIEMAYRWTEPGPAEMRLLLMEGAFTGEMVLLDAVVSLAEDAA